MAITVRMDEPRSSLFCLLVEIKDWSQLFIIQSRTHIRPFPCLTEIETKEEIVTETFGEKKVIKHNLLIIIGGVVRKD